MQRPPPGTSPTQETGDPPSASTEEVFTVADWQTLVESAPDLVLRVDLQGVVRFASRGLGARAPADLLGRPWYQVLPGGASPAAIEALRGTLQEGERRAFEIEGELDGNPSWWSCSLGPVRRGPQVAGAVVIARDITAQKMTEAQLVLSDRLASVGILAAGVAHEINNPLAAVMANLEMALRDLDSLPPEVLPVEVTGGLRDALEASSRVRQIVRDLRLFSRADDHKIGPVDVRKVIDSTLRMAWNEIRHRAKLVVQHGRVPAVHGNESRLGQVFLNLILNAAHAIPEGNHDGNEIRVWTEVDEANRVVIGVSDTGEGIPPEVQKRLFSPFFTTKPVGLGTGLGLVICQKIVSEGGGQLTFTSEVGKGSEFRVILPVSETTVLPPPPREAAPRPVARRGRVLVVDDEPALTATLTRLLSRQHEVTAVNSAHEALRLFRSGARYDVVLCDLMMPQITGADLHAEVSRTDPAQAQRFVFLTGGAFTPGARAVLDNLPNQKVDKPFDIAELSALVNALVERAAVPGRTRGGGSPPG